MEELDEKHLEQVSLLLSRLGAERSQAEIMARQLFKRAKQISRERGVNEAEALETLLKQVVEARQGP